MTCTAARKPKRRRVLKGNREIIAFLQQKGLVGKPTAEEKRLAAEWRALSDEKKKQVNQALCNIRLDQTVAELIAKVRS